VLTAQRALSDSTILGKRFLLAHARRVTPKVPFEPTLGTKRVVIFLDVEPYGRADRHVPREQTWT
jgi:hypothetical protein